MTKQIFHLLIHLPIKSINSPSFHSVNALNIQPGNATGCTHISKVISAYVSHSRMEQPQGMLCKIRSTHSIHNTQTTVGPHNSASATIPSPVSTSVTLLLAMLLLTWFGRVNVQKVFLTSCERGRVVLKANVLNSKLTGTKVLSTCNTFKSCFWC
jgi:hypothetical protein